MQYLTHMMMPEERCFARDIITKALIYHFSLPMMKMEMLHCVQKPMMTEKANIRNKTQKKNEKKRTKSASLFFACSLYSVYHIEKFYFGDSNVQVKNQW